MAEISRQRFGLLKQRIAARFSTLPLDAYDFSLDDRGTLAGYLEAEADYVQGGDPKRLGLAFEAYLEAHKVRTTLF